jgi:hypothetical protein
VANEEEALSFKLPPIVLLLRKICAPVALANAITDVAATGVRFILEPPPFLLSFRKSSVILKRALLPENPFLVKLICLIICLYFCGFFAGHSEIFSHKRRPSPKEARRMSHRQKIPQMPFRMLIHNGLPMFAMSNHSSQSKEAPK